MKFLCDEMLSVLARWLRAAGYDAAQAHPGENDRALVERAQNEGRVLLTRDRALLGIKGAKRVSYLLDNGTVDDWARQLRTELGVNWLAAPFTRCLMCNVPLVAAEPQAIAHMPETSRTGPGPFRQCPQCQRAYWPGSHVKRMKARLEGFAGLQNPDRP